MNRWSGQENQKRFVFTLIYFSFIPNHRQKYRKGHVFSVSHATTDMLQFLRISHIPETTSQYSVSQ